jgi:hypothetical protein
MAKEYDPYTEGKAAFAKGKRPVASDDRKFVEYIREMSIITEEGTKAMEQHRAIREATQEAKAEWKRGWMEGRIAVAEEAEKAKKKVTKKKASKKKVTKKKASKKKASKKKSNK